MDWLLGQLRAESELMLKAPFAFAVFVVFGFFLGYVVATWYYSGRMADQDGQLARYRVALGLDNRSDGALITLTNEELRAKAMATVEALRAFNIALRNETESATRGAKDDKDRGERSMRVLKNKSDDFDRTLKADAVNIDTELRRRLGPKAVASIVGVPPSFFSASDGAPIGVTSLLPSGSGMSAGFAGVLADGIEQMARVLPTS
jgi:hypothetical protein